MINTNIYLHIYAAADDVREDMPGNEVHVWYLDFEEHYAAILDGKTVTGVTLHNISEAAFDQRFPEIVKAVHAAAGSNILVWTELNSREDFSMTDDQITAAETHNPTVTIEQSPAPLAPVPVPVPVEDDIDRMTVKQMVRHCAMMFRETAVSLANYASGHDADLAEIRAVQAAQAETLERLLAAVGTKDERVFSILERTIDVTDKVNQNIANANATLEKLDGNLSEVYSAVNSTRLELAEHTGLTRGALRDMPANLALALPTPPTPNKYSLNSGLCAVALLVGGLIGYLAAVA